MTTASQKTLYRKLARNAAQIAADKKARDIAILDLLDKSAVAEFVVLATVESRPQMEAVAEEISRKFKEEGYPRLHSEGRDSGQWQVLDFGGMLVHILVEQARQFYGLDKLFHFAKKVVFTDAVPSPARPRKTPAKKKK
ncbi:MAG: ribosome silencing factor [Elusimicrobia bacterium]|nr:ribosome silencing factor [Elusimicrobiota bacterium]